MNRMHEPSKWKTAAGVLSLLLLLTAGQALAGEETITANHALAPYVMADAVDLYATISYAEKPTALALQVQIPQGWAFDSAKCLQMPDVVPDTGAGGTLEFVWIDIPEGPLEFSYRLTPEPDYAGQVEISASVLYRRLEGERQQSVLPSPLVFSRR